MKLCHFTSGIIHDYCLSILSQQTAGPAGNFRFPENSFSETGGTGYPSNGFTKKTLVILSRYRQRIREMYNNRDKCVGNICFFNTIVSYKL